MTVMAPHEMNEMKKWVGCSHESSEVRMMDEKWPIMIIVVNILIWIGHERKEFQNDRRVEGWMKIDFFNLFIFIFVAHTNDSTNQLQSSVFFILN